MIKGLGTDILEVERFKKVLNKHPKRFLSRLFSQEECKYCEKYKDALVHYAARFSVKEAVAKALGCGIGQHLSFKDIIIDRDPSGKPIIRFTQKVVEKFNDPQIEISMSHCQKYVTATAIWY